MTPTPSGEPTPLAVRAEDVEAADKFRRGWGGKYDRDAAMLTAAFARHRQAAIIVGIRIGLEAAINEIGTSSRLEDPIELVSAIRAIDIDTLTGDTHGREYPSRSAE